MEDPFLQLVLHSSHFLVSLHKHNTTSVLLELTELAVDLPDQLLYKHLNIQVRNPKHNYRSGSMNTSESTVSPCPAQSQEVVCRASTDCNDVPGDDLGVKTIEECWIL